MAFAIEAEGKRLVYSGDAGLCDALRDLAREADFLVHWCYCLSDEELHPAIKAMCPNPAEIAQMADRAGVKRLLLSHFRVHMDTEAGHRGAREELTANFSGAAGIAEDLDVFEI